MPRAVGNHLRSLARLWDDIDEIRARVRGEHCVLDCGGKPTFHATVKTCAGNCEAILPALMLTKATLDSQLNRHTYLWSCCKLSNYKYKSIELISGHHIGPCKSMGSD